jgi:hypothetical protein
MMMCGRKHKKGLYFFSDSNTSTLNAKKSVVLVALV